ncbi:MAG: ATP-binding protein, partial [Planctomycetaceae bacterium]|nr:ATP-binding protein [Planctomycetaceae bacterium]
KDITPIRRSFRRSDFSISKSDYYDGGKEKKRDFFHKICGFTSDIMVDDLTLFFHSHRKVQEGNPRLGSLLEGRYSQHISKYREEPLVSVFKRVALFSIMSRANLFDGIANNDSEVVLNKLNELIEQYANGKITKLRPAPDDTIEFRIQPATGKESFNFDGLSSGQKEIISTLFLIWHETREHPRIVLIDEPELHLNSQWHRSFINYLIKMAPNNQYIIATHSEAIMESVEKNRRVLLQNSE